MTYFLAFFSIRLARYYVLLQYSDNREQRRQDDAVLQPVGLGQDRLILSKKSRANECSNSSVGRALD